MVNLFFGGISAEGEPDKFRSFFGTIAHGKQNVGRLGTSGSTGRTGRSADSLQIQPHDRFFTRDTGKCTAENAGACRTLTGDPDFRAYFAKSVFEKCPQCSKPRLLLRQ